eukprot:GHVN01000805.1.p3 GENE.GHVN01000805.1~~GHVN01000805.1.p3  ORF type:complete len:250 (+),score=39.79 GHVN01000805.1:4153-4902(+)
MGQNVAGVDGFLVVGLTGGIGAGKTLVANHLKEQGASVINADLLAHEAYEKGGGDAVIAQLVSAFGSKILTADGSIDRKGLGDVVFGNNLQMKRLTGKRTHSAYLSLFLDVVWPAIHEKARERISQVKKRGQTKSHSEGESVTVGIADHLIVLEAAVLLEAEWCDLVDVVWLVYTTDEVAKQRVKTRDCIPEEKVEARLKSQMSNEARILSLEKGEKQFRLLNSQVSKELLMERANHLVKEAQELRRVV